jgi:hypothetical protein
MKLITATYCLQIINKLPYSLLCNIIPSGGPQVRYFPSFHWQACWFINRFISALQQAVHQLPWSAEPWWTWSTHKKSSLYFGHVIGIYIFLLKDSKCSFVTFVAEEKLSFLKAESFEMSGLEVLNLFVVCLLAKSIRTTDLCQMVEWLVNNIWKWCGRKWSWPNLVCYPDMKGLRKTTKILVREPLSRLRF